MEDYNKPVLDEIIRNAFPKVNHFQYKITEYSLNSTFSFKFENLSHFIEFLKQHQSVTDEEIALLENSLKELNLQSHSFFFVNFFE
ncbi:hypothetical protein FLAN108750_06070 [Flavobacterium antarcticum]|uniref:hypothetical protein n=1 Tax=Flavobacterium antarcticum TaxID=271155 RepID=UPI0003B7287F|nr:hypothetical protein [Flavobacterium antarcticum]